MSDLGEDMLKPFGCLLLLGVLALLALAFLAGSWFA